MRRPEAGQSVAEISVMVFVLMVLAGSLLPVMGDSIASARVARARNDATRIAAALANLRRDVGRLRPAATAAELDPFRGGVAELDLLASSAPLPAVAGHVPGEPVPAGARQSPLQPWRSPLRIDLLETQLRTNGPGYPASVNGAGSGWNGPYLPAALSSDPWGHAFLVNAGFLQRDLEGLCRDCAVFVLSAGPNGFVETPFAQPVSTARAFGDDIVIRIQ